ALRLALDMGLDERKQRWQALMEAAKRFSIDNWAETFLARLNPAEVQQGAGPGRDILYLASMA
ncbi:MAG: hypothetical protein ABI414_15400, partial [Devosia sp.]